MSAQSVVLQRPTSGWSTVIMSMAPQPERPLRPIAAAMFGLDCDVYMGTDDVARQSLNVFRMKLLGTTVRPVDSGSRTLKDAINEAMRDWVTRVRDTHYILGSVLGPHPFPVMVRDFHRVIGAEAREQVQALVGRLPDVLVACVGGGSNAIGLFHPFLDDKAVKIYGVEAAGDGIAEPADLLHAVTARQGREHRLSAYRGRKVFLATWASW